MRGYEGSEGDAAADDAEIGMYRDAAAAVNEALRRGIPRSKIIAHGYSLGGVLAAAAAQQHQLAALVLDHAFCNPGAVANNRFSYGHVGLPQFMWDGVARGAFNKGELGEIEKGHTVETDSCDNIAKLQNYKGGLVVIYGTEDSTCTPADAQALLAAHTSGLQASLCIDGGHHNMQFYDDNLDQLRFAKQLKLVLALQADIARLAVE